MLHNTPFYKLPINEYEWMLAGVMFWIFVARSWYLYSRTGNTFTAALARTWFFWALGTMFYTIPLLFTFNEHILRDTTLMADICMNLGFLMQARIVWDIALKRYFSFAYILVPFLTLVALMVYINYPVTTVNVANGLIGWNETTTSSEIYGCIILVTILPLCWYFLRQLISAKEWKARLKHFLYFFAYTTIAITQGYSSIFTNRADTDFSATLMIVIFIILIISVIWSSLRPSKSLSTTT